MQEKRLQRRVGIEVPIQVSRLGSDAPIAARYQDLSWGGASFVTSDLGIRNGERLIMRFPWTSGQTFVIEADVVRCEPLEPGYQRVAARFATIAQQDENRLEKLIELLSTNSREAAHATVMTDTPAMPLLELVIDDKDELCDKLSQIAEGHLFITAFGIYRVGQSLLLLIEHTEEFPGLRLRARVKSQSMVYEEADDSERPCLVTLRLGFEHPLDELRNLAQRSLRFCNAGTRLTDHRR